MGELAPPSQAMDEPCWFVTVNPLKLEPKLYRGKQEATQAAIEAAQVDGTTFILWQFSADGHPVKIGLLWRPFGNDFDPANCWV